MTAVRRPLLVDKNILQGWSRARIEELSNQYELLMPDALFFEMMSTTNEARAKCFSKLPQRANPIVLVDHIGKHLRYELEHGKPLGRPSDHPIDLNYRFNPNLSLPDYELPADVRRKVAEEVERLRPRVTHMIERALTVGRLLQDNVDARLPRPIRLGLFREMIADLDGARSFVRQLVPPPGERSIPNPSAMDGSWAILRHSQVHLFFAVDIWERYGDDVLLGELNERRYQKIEHDVMDAEYLALATLEGAFASEEKKLRNLFRVLCPNGVLVPD